ncbi:hypothetical protein EZV62_014513 [Acer yangbiense]|uniref:Cyclin N-terminal domain-containing protein n=1 Tax=Acer yangbiense TaxID=1000413 RepID=A0A5C7HSG2_9ROSI|nr:hypothetical protein EZV62_014513 [Acer yangbiense]
MSVSSNCNLYCTELASDVVSLDPSFDSFIDDDHDENYIVSIFNSEVDQMQSAQLLAKFRKLPELVSARQEAIKWMLKVHNHYRFKPETSYLSVNYLDRFLLSHSFPAGKKWLWQLLSVACLALAAKLEETSVPLLLDLQIMEPNFLFKPKTVQRMELLVMATLKWRLRTITPFDFLHFFVHKLSRLTPQRNGFSTNCLISSASDVIIRTCKVIDFLDYHPSTIAAAVVIWATGNHIVDDQKLGCFHKRVNRDMVKRCYNLIKRNLQVPLNGKLGVLFRGSCDAVKTSNYKKIKSNQDLPVPIHKCLKSGND